MICGDAMTLCGMQRRTWITDGMTAQKTSALNLHTARGSSSDTQYVVWCRADWHTGTDVSGGGGACCCCHVAETCSRQHRCETQVPLQRLRWGQRQNTGGATILKWISDRQIHLVPYRAMCKDRVTEKSALQHRVASNGRTKQLYWSLVMGLEFGTFERVTECRTTWLRTDTWYMCWKCGRVQMLGKDTNRLELHVWRD